MGTTTVGRLVHTLAALPRVQSADVAVSAGVIAVVLGARRITRRIPGALIAVAGAIIATKMVGLAGHHVATIGSVPRGLPQLGPPALGLHDAALLLGGAVSMFVVILTQSAATARAYAAKHQEAFSEDTDLAGLAAANIGAAFSGTFVVNGSPTKTQMADSAGGRSQLAQLTTSAMVLIVLVTLTGPLSYLPVAALAAVVFLIGAELVDLPGLRRILSVRRGEFVVAVLAAAAVIAFGVEDGIFLAIAASIIDHLRHSYRPLSSVLVKSPAGHWNPVPVTPHRRTEPGLAIYRFGTSLYYANASRLLEDITALTAAASPLRWLVLDAAAIGDVDFTAASVLRQIIEQLHGGHVFVAVTSLLSPVRQQLDRYGISGHAGPDAYFDTPGEALEAYHATWPGGGPETQATDPPPTAGPAA